MSLYRSQVLDLSACPNGCDHFGDHMRQRCCHMQDITFLVEKGVSDAQQKLHGVQRASKLDSEPNHYAVLGIASSATTSDIRMAFRWGRLSAAHNWK